MERGIIMGDIKELLDHSKLERLMSLVIYGPDCESKLIENYEKEIDHSYKVSSQKIRELFQTDKEQMDQVMDILYDLGETHDMVYFEAGATFGFQLYKDLEKKYNLHKSEKILAPLGYENKEPVGDHIPGDQTLSALLDEVEKMDDTLRKYIK